MGILDRYVISNFLKLFFLVTSVSVSLTVLYSLADFLLGFKVKEFKVLKDYLLTLIPLSFYILSPLLLSISTLLFFKRVFAKRTDLTVMSFGLSPLRFALPIVMLSFGLSTLFLVLNESFIPSLLKSAWYIEKTFKKKKVVDTGRIVRNIWFAKEVEGAKIFAYIGNLDIGSGVFTDVFMLKVSKDNKVLEVVEGIIGIWEGDRIEILTGQAYSFERGVPIERLENFSLNVGINKDEVSLFAQRISHLSSSALLTLYTKGSKIGLDVNRYLSELIYRVGMSFYPFFANLLLIYLLMRERSLKIGFVGNVVILIVLWLLISSARLLPEKAGVDPKYSLLGFALLLLVALKSIYDLSKGFRV